MSRVSEISIKAHHLPGVSIATSGEWDGRLLLMSRRVFEQYKAKAELNVVGAYVVYADHFDKTSYGHDLYVGQGDDVRARLAKHLKEKPFWNKVLVFTSEKMNSTLAYNIESQLIQKAKFANRYRVVNGDDGQKKKMSDIEKSYVNQFVQKSVEVCQLAQIDVFAFNEDGVFLLEERGNTAMMRTMQESTDHVSIEAGSVLWKYYLEGFDLKSLDSGAVEFVENVAIFRLQVVVKIDWELIPRIFGRLLHIKKFRTNCGASADQVLKARRAEALSLNG